jgi:hypothetical protein
MIIFVILHNLLHEIEKNLALAAVTLSSIVLGQGFEPLLECSEGGGAAGKGSEEPP